MNNGLNEAQLQAKQKPPLQSGLGWYAAYDIDVAEFFGSLAVDALTDYTIALYRTKTKTSQIEWKCHARM
ncbi:hypothetical protein QUF64_04375 [Anaerolineales bacterium HSG6]|nr:hypothetical protein [Anaerolineales bacterium HSG6]MDM8530671.1 hypothetical protein [Anaerolineales bacterium HSG25]